MPTFSRVFTLAVLLGFSLQVTGLAANCPTQSGQQRQEMPEVSAERTGGGATSSVVENRNAVQDTVEQCQKDTPPAPRECPDEPHRQEPDPQEPDPQEPGTITPTGPQAELLNAIQTAGQVEAFNLLFDASLSTDIDQVSEEDLTILFSITEDPAFDQGAFLGALDRTGDLYTALLSDTNARSQFDALFGTSLSSDGALTAADRAALFAVGGDPAFDIEAFSDVLPAAWGLLSALQADAAALAAFNEQFETDLAASGAVSAEARTQLFNIAGDPAFDLNAFLEQLVGAEDDGTTLPPTGDGTFTGAAGDLLAALQADDSTDEFNRLFGTAVGDTGNTGSNADIQLMADLTGDPAFSLPSFRSVIPVTGALLAALQNNRDQRDQFNSLFGTGLDDDDAPSAADRGALFDLAGDPTFDQEDFLDVLADTAELLSALQADAALRAGFNGRFGTDIGTSAPTAQDRARLFSLAGDPAFDLEALLGTLDASADLSPQISPISPASPPSPNPPPAGITS